MTVLDLIQMLVFLDPNATVVMCGNALLVEEDLKNYNESNTDTVFSHPPNVLVEGVEEIENHQVRIY